MSTGPSRVAVVTGAARGIGAATALRLAQDGLDVAVLDLDAERCADTVSAVRATGRRSVAFAVDVSDADSVQRAVEAVVDELGAPTVLVNNAGILHDAPLADLDPSDWQRLLGIHLGGAYNVSRAVHGHMVAAGFGRIVMLSSTAALGDRHRVHYATAKAGLQGFTKALAIDLGHDGVTVNCVAPGFTVTPMTQALAQERGMDFADLERQRAKVIAVGRPGTPEDIAHAIAFFADERSGFVSGQVLYVAGGPVC